MGAVRVWNYARTPSRGAVAYELVVDGAIRHTAHLPRADIAFAAAQEVGAVSGGLVRRIMARDDDMAGEKWNPTDGEVASSLHRAYSVPCLAATSPFTFNPSVMSRLHPLELLWGGLCIPPTLAS